MNQAQQNALLAQCQQWLEEDQPQKIIDAIQAVPANQRTPELDSELARALNTLADPDEKELFQQAVDLLLPHAAYFQGDHNWNYRLGYAYYYLNREDLALHYFEQALKARPGDSDTQELIEACQDCLSLPRFEQNFRERTEVAWEAFVQQEEKLRRLLDAKDRSAVAEELVETCDRILHLAFADVCFELGVSGEKYELILSPEGNKAKLFELVYFQNHAPAQLLTHWNFWVGRQPAKDFSFQVEDWRLSGEEVRVWVEQQDNGVNLTLFCEKLLPLLHQDENRAWWMLSTLTDQVLGEVNTMALILDFQVVEIPPAGEGILLQNLPQMLKELDLPLLTDPREYLASSYMAYKLSPEQEPQKDWRLDVFAGSTLCPALVSEYLKGESTTVDGFYADGVAAGFLCYPLDGFTGDGRAEAILDFRDELEAALAEKVGEEAVAFLGGATGLYCGYLDLIAWDLPAVLDAAVEFLQGTTLLWANFHIFRRDAGTIRLLNREEEVTPQIHPETGSLLGPEELETLASFAQGSSGYFYQMLAYLHDWMEDGVKAKRFIRQQAHEDLQIALWYAYGCLNVDEYVYYYRAVQWMKESEKNAKGCGTWYYRYAVALMYCGRLEEAKQYSEQGVLEEPDYPWGWLELAKLRSYFGEKEAALQAVEQGLALVPEDYEFLTLRKEILEDASLEQMEYHWIDPGLDQKLQEGLDEDANDKQRAISCIVLFQEGLDRFTQLFHLHPADWEWDDPYCHFYYVVQDHPVDLVFQMNRAGLSKLRYSWLKTQKERLDDGRWFTQEIENGRVGLLHTILFGLDYRVSLIYYLPQEEKYFQLWLLADGTPASAPVFLEEEPLASTPGTAPEYYSQEEAEVLETHIARYFGEYPGVFHELVSPDLHLDVCVIPPTEEKNYYTLVTLGMGAHRMNVPPEWADRKLERAELVLALPPDWKLDQDALQQDQWYWPIRLLKTLARLPGETDSWLGWGHTIENKAPFDQTTDLCGALLIGPQQVEEGGEVCTLPDGDEVNFYQVIPLYFNEMEYKISHSAEELLDRLAGVSFVVRPDRPNISEQEETEDRVLDDAQWHLESIRGKNLPVEEISAYNHLAIYLRWCMEQELMAEQFWKRYPALAEGRKDGFALLDLRAFIQEELNGRLLSSFFNETGQAFSDYYYGDGNAPYYPSDIDNYALEYFGPKRYHSQEFSQEAYLFLPFEEAYYQGMAQVIWQRWEAWQRQELGEDLDPPGLAQTMMDYLHCNCQYFPPMKDDDPITAAYSYALRLGMREGYVPVLIGVDETLWETLVLNSDPDSDSDNTFHPEAVAAYRRALLDSPLPEGKEVLGRRFAERQSEVMEAGWDWNQFLGRMEGGQANDRFLSYWDYDTEKTVPLILAEIPVKKPWQIFAYLPFGGWNDCPGTEEWMAVAKKWYEQYGAVPAAVTHDQLEFVLPAPVPQEQALELAKEQYAICPDVVEQGPEDATIGMLADTLQQSTLWYFWWD